MASQHTFQIRLSCKKVSSGNCQVRFQVKMDKEKQYYGYFLTRPEEKLKDVVSQLNTRLAFLKQSGDPLHSHLYSLGRRQSKLNDFIIFQSKAL